MSTSETPAITPELLLHAYAMGVFPMSDSRAGDEVFWVDPTLRGILPLDGFHISRSLAREIRAERYNVRFDTDFAGVLAACADRPETWINAEISSLYKKLHKMGFAHSVEIWEGDTLVGGSYGVALGAAFFGESMFSRRNNTSKIALAYLVDRLRAGGFCLFDTQFITDHLATLGGIEISRKEYQERLQKALNRPAHFPPYSAAGTSGAGILQRNTQTS